MCLDVGDGRVLQVLLGADRGLLAVRVVRVERPGHGLVELLAVAGQGHVLLLIDGLQLGVEAADHQMTETVGLDTGPVVDLVGGDVLGIDGLVVGGPGVGPGGADDSHQFVILVGDRQLGGLETHGIDLVVDGQALRLVRGLAVDLEQALDLVQHGLLGSIVGRAELLGALEHDVLQVVGHARGLGRVVLAAHLDGHVGLDAGLFLVDGHEDLHAVVQGVDLGLQGVAGNGLITLAGAGRQKKERGRRNQEDFFRNHNKCVIH